MGDREEGYNSKSLCLLQKQELCLRHELQLFPSKKRRLDRRIKEWVSWVSSTRPPIRQLTKNRGHHFQQPGSLDIQEATVGV